MALDEIEDLQLAALATLVVGGVRAELGAEVIVRGYAYPILGTQMPELQRPAYAIYRSGERALRRSMRGPLEQLVTFTFEYEVSATPLTRMETRWPLLQAVWHHTLLVVAAGQHADVSANAELLQAAGFVAIDRESPQVRYNRPTDTNPHPSFVGTMVLKHREEYDRSALIEFLELAGAIHRTDGNADIQPQVEFLADADDA